MRFYGEVGYAVAEEKRPGQVVNTLVERPLRGDILSAGRVLESDDKVNRDFGLNHRISVVADPYALAHYALIKYVKMDGVRWVVTTVTIQRPRLILQLGGVFNGPAGTPFPANKPSGT